MVDVDFKSIEKKWVERWDNAKLGEAKRDSAKPKFSIIFAYPGPGGYLHVGHMRGYSYTDMIGRYKRMRGYNVMFPVGTHASGNQAIAFAKKVEKKDKNWIDYLIANGCSKEKIKELVEPENIVEYFNNNYLEQWKNFGFLADWKRFACTIHSDYNKFIQWQFKKLKQNDLLVQKPYYGTFCPECGPVAVDASETDISKGGNAEKYEYTLLKFKFEDSFLLAATLRPETIYGQTNLWINP
jgi:leucyl-tRNA synthetase